MASSMMRAAKLVLAAASTLLVVAPMSASASEQLEKLGPQALNAGQCGLFLWSRSEDQPLVAVAYDNPSTVSVRIDGRVRQLNRTGFSGEPLSGHFQSQTYSRDGFTLGIDVEFDAERPVRDGVLIKRGLVRYGRDGEPETIMSVGGIAACKRA